MKLLPYLAVAGLFFGVTLAWNILLPRIVKDSNLPEQQPGVQQTIEALPATRTDTLSAISDTAHYSEKVGFITHRLDLSVGEAQAFWPVYNKYQKAKDSILREQNMLLQNQANWAPNDSAQYAPLFSKYLEHYKHLNHLRRHYHTKFLEILPAGKVFRLYQAEKAFKQHLLESMEQKP